MAEEKGLKDWIEKRKQQNRQEEKKHIEQKNEFEQWIEQCNLLFNDVKKWLEKYDQENIKTNIEEYKGNKMMVIKVQTYNDSLRLLPVFGFKRIFMSKFKDIVPTETDPAEILETYQRIAGFTTHFGGDLNKYRFHPLEPIPKGSKLFEIEYKGNWTVNGKDLNDSLFIKLLEEILGE